MDNVIFISDTHSPYQHKDTLKFLEAIKWEYDIKIAKHVGDVVDNHFSSFHPIEYGTLSAKDEHLQAKKFVQALHELFPIMTISLGNHCIMSSRKAKMADIPLDHLKSYNDMYEIDGWKWVDKDYFKVDKYNNCLMVHAMSKGTLNNAKTHSHHSVQGHYHGTFGIEYFADTEVLRWSMTVGCLIDTDNPAFNYSRGYTNNKPIIGCGLLIDNLPVLQPMQLTKSGRWNNRL
jgi:hypothetical protein